MLTDDVIPATNDATTATKGMASAMWDTAEATGNQTAHIVTLKEKNAEYFDGLNMGLDTTIKNFQESLAWIAGGGQELTREAQRIMESVSADVQYSAAAAYTALQEVQIKALALKVDMGTITADQAAQNIRDTLGLSLQAALDLVNQVRLNANFDVDSYVRVHINEIYGSDRTGESRVGGEQTDAGGANGLDMTVPPGYPNDSFRIGATSGEHVYITNNISTKP